MKTSAVTRTLLALGLAGGVLFMPISLVQAFTRAGFDIRRHPLSLLLLGDLGWIQVLNFVLCGALAVAFAIGLRRLIDHENAGTWGPLLVGGFGVGTVVAGVLHPDPSLGFPAGAPAGVPATMSWHSSLHGVGFAIAFLALTAACFVFARHFGSNGDRRWAAYCIGTGVITPLLAAVGIASGGKVGVAFAVAGALAWFWLAAIAAKLIAESGVNRLSAGRRSTRTGLA